MGLLSGDAALTVVPLDNGTVKLIGDQAGRALKPQEDIGNQTSAGVSDNASQLMQNPNQVNQQAAGSGQDASMLQAIRNQYGQVASKSIDSIKNQNQMNSAITRSQWQHQAARSALAMQQVETQNFQSLAKAMSDAEMARAQVLSSIFGAVGVGAGMYLGGRKNQKTLPPSAGYGGPSMDPNEYASGRGNASPNDF